MSYIGSLGKKDVNDSAAMWFHSISLLSFMDIQQNKTRTSANPCSPTNVVGTTNSPLVPIWSEQNTIYTARICILRPNTNEPNVAFEHTLDSSITCLCGRRRGRLRSWSSPEYIIHNFLHIYSVKEVCFSFSIIINTICPNKLDYCSWYTYYI